MPQYFALINNLVVTTDRFIMGSRTASNPSSRSSSQGTKPRIAPAPLAWSVALRSSRDITIQASIEYVVCLPTLIPFTYLNLRIGRSREYIDHTNEPILTSYLPLGYWRSLWSSLDFADQPLKSCVNIIHVDIVEIWNLYDRNRVSTPYLPCCSNCSTESVSVKQPIQNKYVTRRQRSSRADWQRAAGVSILHFK